ncbi:transglycosylase domain-containing protein [Glycomyces buryatensis]|uniref:transglycosylase domain-containing protein n=1 Tax=Glycomyces buryatensis TaxID=2570927 RepID=UPI00145628EB|nr:transglycosylase domain-containing protein [Glycomyces buryatensis]
MNPHSGPPHQGGPAVPGGPGDHGGAPGNVGRASVVGAVRKTMPLGKKPKSKSKKRMSMRRRRVYAALIMAVLMMLGAGTVAGATYFENVPEPKDLAYGESTTITLADGTPVAGYGEYTRKLVDDYEEIPDEVVWSLLALEDKNFFEHDGVDWKGTTRALVNNVTGGDTQGASTITQQYAGMVEDIRGDISYGRKAKEAIMAMKMEQDYSKEEILTHYLNLNFYGRGAYGIAAASEVWFGEKVKDLDWGQAMMLVMQVKAGDGSFDPRVAGEDSTAPQDRWDYGMNELKKMGHIDQAEIDAGMPETEESLENPGTWGNNTPTGFLTNPTDGYIWDELYSRYGLTQNDFYGKDEDTGGYTVELTINSKVQDAAEDTASRGDLKRQEEDGVLVDDNGDPVEEEADAAEYENEDGYYEFKNDNENAALYKQNPSMANAVVAVEPGTGRVLGYYGGENGLGVDKAGLENPHPPSSTFKMITAATAVKNNASIDSWWNSDSPREFDSLEDFEDNAIENAGTDENTDRTLTDAVRDSRNTPMYAIAEKYGATAILQTAIDMGLRTLTQTEDGEPVTYKFYRADDGTITYSRHGVRELDDGTFETLDNGNINPMASLDGYEDDEVTPKTTELDLESKNSPFYYHIGFGQYPTTVKDMATVYATIAADGVYNETHFVEKVYDRDGNEYPEQRPLEQTQALTTEIARNLQYVGSTIDGDGGAIDRPYTGKTGTWEAAEEFSPANAHTWYVGAIPQLSIATWVGNATAESAPLLNPEGSIDGVFGSTLSYPVWKQFMEGSIDAMGYDSQAWGEAAHVGSPITDDIENEDGTIDPSSPYCAANPTDTRCGVPGGDGGGNGNGGDENCTPIQEMLDLCEQGGGDGDGDGGGGNGNGNGNGNGGNDDDD